MTEAAAKRPSKYMTMREVYSRMADLGVPQRSVLRQVQRGNIPGGEEAYPGRIIVHRDTFETWFDNRPKISKVPDRRKLRRKHGA